MATRSLFPFYVTAGITCLGLAQVYLLGKLRRLIRRSQLPPRLHQILFGVACAFVALMYMPYPLRLLYRWPEQEVSAVVVYSLLYPFSLWGMICVSIFFIVCVKDLGVAIFHLWRRSLPAWSSLDKPLAAPLCTTRREFLRWSFGALTLSPAGVFAYGAAVGKERYEIVEHTIKLPRLSSRLAG